MMEGRWNPWKLTAIGMALVVAAAVITGLVVASWNSKEKGEPVAQQAKAVTAPPGGAVQRAAVKPSASDIEACNQYAQSRVGDKTAEMVKDAVVGGVIGAGVGAVSGAVVGGKNVGKGAAVGGLVGATAGTLYGINETNKNDERYREAYRSCMRGRGYTE